MGSYSGQMCRIRADLAGEYSVNCLRFRVSVWEKRRENAQIKTSGQMTLDASIRGPTLVFIEEGRFVVGQEQILGEQSTNVEPLTARTGSLGVVY